GFYSVSRPMITIHLGRKCDAKCIKKRLLHVCVWCSMKFMVQCSLPFCCCHKKLSSGLFRLRSYPKAAFYGQYGKLRTMKKNLELRFHSSVIKFLKLESSMNMIFET